MEPGSRFWDVPAAMLGLGGSERATVVVARGADPREALRASHVPIALEGKSERLAALIADADTHSLAAGMLVVRVRTPGAAPDALAAGCRVALAPGASDDIEPLALSGAMVEMRDLWAWTTEAPGALARALELYLTHPRLESPIEPFHSLARGMARREGRGLRAVTREIVRRDWRLTAEGQVTLSERHEREGAVLGRLEEGESAWRASELWLLAEGRERRHFLGRTRCSLCDHWLACGGYGAGDGAEADPRWCEAWIPLFSRLRAAYATALRAASEAESMDYPG